MILEIIVEIAAAAVEAFARNGSSSRPTETERRRRLRSVVGCSCGDCEANRLKLWNKDINLKESA